MQPEGSRYMGSIVDAYRRTLTSLVSSRQVDERGAALVEYALLLILIAVFCMVAVTYLGHTAADKFSTVGQSVANA